MVVVIIVVVTVIATISAFIFTIIIVVTAIAPTVVIIVGIVVSPSLSSNKNRPHLTAAGHEIRGDMLREVETFFAEALMLAQPPAAPHSKSDL